MVAESLFDLDRVQDLDRRRRRRTAPRHSAPRGGQVALGFAAPARAPDLVLPDFDRGSRPWRGPVLPRFGLRLGDPLHPSDLVPEQRRDGLPRARILITAPSPSLLLLTPPEILTLPVALALPPPRVLAPEHGRSLGSGSDVLVFRPVGSPIVPGLRLPLSALVLPGEGLQLLLVLHPVEEALRHVFDAENPAGVVKSNDFDDFDL